jgi:hypothetical protein
MITGQPVSRVSPPGTAMPALSDAANRNVNASGIRCTKKVMDRQVSRLCRSVPPELREHCLAKLGWIAVRPMYRAMVTFRTGRPA